MKKLKLLLCSMLVGFTCLSSLLNVKAAGIPLTLIYASNDSTSIPSDWNNVNSKWTVQIAGLLNPTPINFLYLNGQLVYCIEPLVTTIGGAEYNAADLGAIASPAAIGMLTNISYLGYGYKGDTSKEMLAATQLVMWQRLGVSINFIHPDIQAKMNIINQRYDRFNVKPSLNNATPTLKGIGEANKVTITDTNGVLEDYHVYSDGGISIRHNGNSFDVWVNDASKLGSTITFDLIHRAVLGNSIAYQSPANHQKVAYLVAGDPLSFNVDVKLALGSLELEKQDNYNNFVPGTKFKISYNSDMSSPIGEYTTSANGKVKIDNLNPQTVYIQEVSAPNHLTVDTTIRSAVVVGDETVIFNAKNTTKKGKITLTKEDRETGGVSQGNTSLLGAKYGLYAQADIVDPGNGNVTHRKDSLISEKTVDANRQIVWDGVTIGSYYVKETLEAPGYNIDSTAHKVVISSTNPNEAIILRNVTSKEDVIRGNVYIVKYLEDKVTQPDLQEPGENIVFKITSKTNGSNFYIKTNKWGHASTIEGYYADEECKNYVQSNARGALPFDTYKIKEVESTTPPGFTPAGEWEFSIDEEGFTPHYIVKNDDVTSAVKVEKIDSTTGKIIPLANTEFRLLDKNKNPITMTTYYPDKVVHETFKTSDKGYLFFPDIMRFGTYYLEEVNAPVGYLKGKLLKFQVDKNGTFEDPIIVKYADDPAKGKVKINKVDEVTNETLANATFDIIAAEDIVTADGTVRAIKGEVVDTITTDLNGVAESKELFLGKYYAKEKKQPNGFILSEKEHTFELKYKDQNTAIVIEELEITNKATSITITKYETGTDVALEGAKYRVWNKAIEEQFITDEIDPEFTIGNAIFDQLMNFAPVYTTDEKGEIIINYLLPGTYRLQEVEGPNGYHTDDMIYEFTVTADGRIEGEENFKLDVYDLPKLFELKVNKVDFYTKEAIKSKSFAFTSYSDEECKKELKTVHANIEDGFALFEELRYGIIYIKETKAPVGYVLSDEVVKVEINDDGFFINDKKIESEEDMKYSIIYYNQLIPTIKAGDDPINNPVLWGGLLCISGLIVVIKRFLDKKEGQKEW